MQPKLAVRIVRGSCRQYTNGQTQCGEVNRLLDRKAPKFGNAEGQMRSARLDLEGDRAGVVGRAGDPYARLREGQPLQTLCLAVWRAVAVHRLQRETAQRAQMPESIQRSAGGISGTQLRGGRVTVSAGNHGHHSRRARRGATCLSQGSVYPLPDLWLLVGEVGLLGGVGVDVEHAELLCLLVLPLVLVGVPFVETRFRGV